MPGMAEEEEDLLFRGPAATGPAATNPKATSPNRRACCPDAAPYLFSAYKESRPCLLASPARGISAFDLLLAHEAGVSRRLGLVHVLFMQRTFPASPPRS